MSNQVQRLIVAGVGIPLGLLAAWYGGLPLVLLVGVVAVLGMREFFHLAKLTGIEAVRPAGYVLGGLAPLATWIAAAPVEDRVGPIESFVAAVLAPLWVPLPWPLAVILIPLVILTAVLLRRPPAERPLAAAGATLLGWVYAAVLPCALLLIRFDAGPERSWPAAWLLFFPLGVTWICDSFAMWGGQLYGRTKLWPVVSPKKTWEGAISGVVGGTGAAIGYSLLILAPLGRPIPIGQAVVMGLVISIIAQIGDLAESLFKREAGVKDSSGLIPGHGGVLDRFDALYFVLPVSAVLFRVLEVTK